MSHASVMSYRWRSWFWTFSPLRSPCLLRALSLPALYAARRPTRKNKYSARSRATLRVCICDCIELYAYLIDWCVWAHVSKRTLPVCLVPSGALFARHQLAGTQTFSPCCECVVSRAQNPKGCWWPSACLGKEQVKHIFPHKRVFEGEFISRYLLLSECRLCGTGCYFGALYALQHGAAEIRGHSRTQAARRNAYQQKTDGD